MSKRERKKERKREREINKYIHKEDSFIVCPIAFHPLEQN
jgi:hypothetical protein